MAELVDATDLKSVIRKSVRVRVPLSVFSVIPKSGVQAAGAEVIDCGASTVRVIEPNSSKLLSLR